MSSEAEKLDSKSPPTPKKPNLFKLIYNVFRAVVKPEQSTDINQQKSLYPENEDMMKKSQQITSDHYKVILTDQELKTIYEAQEAAKTNRNMPEIAQDPQETKRKDVLAEMNLLRERVRQSYLLRQKLQKSLTSKTSTRPPPTTDNNFFRAQLTTDDQVLRKKYLDQVLGQKYIDMEKENNSITRTSLPGATYLASMRHREPTPPTNTNTDTNTNIKKRNPK